MIHPSRIPTVAILIFVIMYYPHPCLLAKSSIAAQNRSHRANDITALRNDIAVARGQQTKPRTHGAFFADGLQVISVVQNTEKRCELMLLQAESSGLYDVVSKCMPAHSFRLFLRTKRVSICSCHLCSDAPYYHDTVDGPSCHPPEFP